MTSIEDINRHDVESARGILFNCCSAQRWVDGMLSARPFADRNELLQTARDIWAGMQEDDWLEAFAGHPKIGDVNSLKAKYAATRALAGHEQSAVGEADDDVIEQLARYNTEYEARFGFIFIVFASGKSAGEMLQLLKRRIGNSRDRELENAAAEQLKITLLRLEKLL